MSEAVSAPNSPSRMIDRQPDQGHQQGTPRGRDAHRQQHLGPPQGRQQQVGQRPAPRLIGQRQVA